MKQITTTLTSFFVSTGVVSLTILSMLFATGCADSPVGRQCFIGADAGPNQVVLASPALECPSRQCLHVPLTRALPEGGVHAALCTAECTSADECEKMPNSPCQTGFTCAIAVQKGPFCCQKMCICKDYITVPEGGIATPAACEDRPENTCINLPSKS